MAPCSASTDDGKTLIVVKLSPAAHTVCLPAPFKPLHDTKPAQKILDTLSAC